MKCLSFITPLRLIVVAAVAAFFWFLILGNQGVVQLVKLFHLKEVLRTEKESLALDVTRLTDERTLLSEPQNLQMVIRAELGVIKPGEIIFQEKKAEEPKGTNEELTEHTDASHR